MVTASMNGNKKVLSVVLEQSSARLVSNVFASRANLVQVEKIDDCFPVQGVKLTIDIDQMLPGDFVARSVVAGNRRKIELLAASESFDIAALLALVDSSVEPTRQFTSSDHIEFANGSSLVSINNAVLVAAPKGR